MEWYMKALQNYVGFSGRAQRKEYWMFFLGNVIILVGFGIVDAAVGLGAGLISALFSLAIFLPGLAVGFRRLHDVGKSGWWVLISLIPLIGALVLLYFLVLDGDPGDNHYGPNPKAA